MKIESLINDLVENRSIKISDLQTFFAELCDGVAHPPEQLAAVLVLLRTRGETAEQLAAIAEVLLARAVLIDIPRAAVCLCGTGGDNSGSFNISTTASLLVAACGIPVAKHGNRSILDFRPRCRVCGEPASKQVTPPSKKFDGYPK